MDNQENEISLSQLFAVFKKSLIRGLIYVLVTIIAATAILVLVKTFTSTNVYDANISFAKTDDTTLSSMNLYKANAVNKALTTDGKDLDISDKVVKNLSVSAVIPADKEKDSSFTPTSFTVSLKTNSDLNLSSGEYKSLVDNIAKEFVNQFATSNMPELSGNVVDVNAQLTNQVEYLQIAYSLSDIIDDYLINLESFASSNSAVAEFAFSNGKTLNSVISDLKYLKSSIDSLKSTIVSRKLGLGNLNAYIAVATISAEAKQLECEKIYDAATTSLASYKATVEASLKDTTSATTIFIQFDDSFTKLAEQANIAAKQLGAAEYKKKETAEFADAIGSATGTSDTNMETSLKSSADTISSMLASYKTLATEFNNNKTAISPATVSKPAYSVAESFVNMKIIIIADLAVALIAYIVAFSQTFTIMKKKGLLK